jgi:hypothetical protein
MWYYCKNYCPSPLLRAFQITLLILIVIGIGLLLTQEKWVPLFVNYLLEREGVANQMEETPRPAYDMSAWLLSDAENVTFKYPAVFSTAYLKPVDWPPVFNLSPLPFACAEAGNAVDRAGETVLRVVNGHAYCITERDEGAAGTLYAQYAYAFSFHGQTGILTFTTRMPTCENYDDPEKAACQEERRAFKLNLLIDAIASTAVWKE